MKSMHIAASCELVSRLSTHRQVVALDSTDFTDAAAVVITAADSRSGILALLKRSGFNLPVYLFSETQTDKPEGVVAVISGKEQEWLELEAAACGYEEKLLPPFSIRLASTLRWTTALSPVPAISMARSLKSIPRAASSTSFSARTFFAPTCATPTSSWAIC